MNNNKSIYQMLRKIREEEDEIKYRERREIKKKENKEALERLELQRALRESQRLILESQRLMLERQRALEKSLWGPDPLKYPQ